jgi:hypothetical protein
VTWVVWRQQRASLLICLALVVLVAIGLIGLRLAAMGAIADLSLTHCLANADGDCPSGALAAFDERFGMIVRLIPLVLLALPLLLGAFGGAPLFAREFEQGTHLFSLTQGVSRRRWWFSKIAVGGLPLTGAMLGLGLLTTWALQPLRPVTYGRLTTPGFESQGLVIGAYFLLAFAVGATAGLLLRNTLAAMAITLAAYLAVLIVLGNAARPHYLPTEHIAAPIPSGAADLTSQPGGLPDDAWIRGTTYVSADGAPVKGTGAACATVTDYSGCLIAHGVTAESIDYHSAAHFWAFQGIEGALVACLSAAVLALGAWRLRRRAT